MAESSDDVGAIEREFGASAPNAAADGVSSPSADPNDELPVPITMWPSEIDERAQVVEALRGKGPPPRTDTQVDPAEDSR